MLATDALRYGYGTVKWLRWLPSVLVLLPWLFGPLVPSEDARLRDVVSPNAFRLLDWETLNLSERAGRLWSGLTSAVTPTPTDADTLRAYFAASSQATPELHSAAEAAIEREIAQFYRNSGLTRSEPLSLPTLFPPLLVALTPPPNVLVVSPRTELRVVDSSVLQAMDVSAQEQLEASADSTGVSSLVAPIGGLATYPSMVLEGDSAERVLSSVAHEWMHQYLIFYPLGAQYWTRQETREINETTAEMIGAEVGSNVAAALGLGTPPPQPTSGARPARRNTFDFTAFMRETRRQVETMLKDGKVDDAEAYMRQRRDELQQHGYAIRKLNQAYFALYGSYGEGFAASPANPIPGLLHKMRDASPTLGDFVVRVRGITTVVELRQATS